MRRTSAAPTTRGTPSITTSAAPVIRRASRTRTDVDRPRRRVPGRRRRRALHRVDAGWRRASHRRAATRARGHRVLGDEVVPVSIHPEIDLDACIGSGACVRACPEDEVLAITDGRARLDQPDVVHRSLGVHVGVPGRRDQARVRHRDARRRAAEADAERSRPAQPGIYVVGELGGMGLIRNAVEQGRQAAARSRVDAARRGEPRRDRRRRRARRASRPRSRLIARGAASVADRRAGSVRRHDRALPAREGRDDRLVRAAGLRHRPRARR